MSKTLKILFFNVSNKIFTYLTVYIVPDLQIDVMFTVRIEYRNQNIVGIVKIVYL